MEIPMPSRAAPFLDMLDAHKGIVYKVARAYCRDAEDRKDLIQEICLQLWLAFGRYDPQYKLSTWIYRIALNVAISAYRKDRRRAALHPPLPGDILLLQLPDVQDPPHPELERLHAFIQSLPSLDRAVMLLSLDGHPQQDIAEVLGLTPSHVATKLHRIRLQLKHSLNPASR
jgi:RNA polymerase sigma-70 factor (ECF subfamily)